MGNCTGGRKYNADFDKREKTMLNDTYKKYCERGPEYI